MLEDIRMESTKRIESLLMKKTAKYGLHNSFWGDGDELRIDATTQYAKNMDVLLYCATNVVVILIPLSSHNSYDPTYLDVCDIIYYSTSLSTRGIDTMGYCSIMCLTKVVPVSDINSKYYIENAIEEVAAAADYFKKQLSLYGYDTGGRLA